MSSSHHLYLNQGAEIIEMLEKLGLDQVTTRRVSFSEILEEEKEEVRQARQVIREYTELGTVTEAKIDPRFIPLSHFPSEDRVEGYHSTLWFFERLTTISYRILGELDKLGVLKSELREVNGLLPTAVYIPFPTRSTRHCAILHIPVSEVKVFTTKERAPYLLCLETFNPHEELLKQCEEIESQEMPSRQRSMSAPTITRTQFVSEDVFTRQEYLTKEAFDSLMTSSDGLNTGVAARRQFMTEHPFNSIAQEHYSTMTVGDIRQSIGQFYDVEQPESPHTIFKESAYKQAERIRAKSPFGNLKTWKLFRIIVKSGDDLRQEQFAMQLISLFRQTFNKKRLHLWLYPYEIIATGPNCGILECVSDAVSIDGLKKALPEENKSLLHFFHTNFGPPKSKRFKLAKLRFMNSLAGYSLVSYILQIKDRHNGNILIDNKGHLIHIDFGFFLSNSPGGDFGFERAPFKLTNDFEAVLGGRRSKSFMKFRKLCVKGFMALREVTDKLVMLVEMTRTGIGASCPCFNKGDAVSIELKNRLNPKPNMNKGDCKEYVNKLIDTSLDNFRTQLYDRCQYCCQNILY